MQNKLKSVLGGSGFYILAAVCLLAVGVGGYRLLLGGPASPGGCRPHPGHPGGNAG